MANIADPDQLASSEANWSAATLFAKVGYIRVQQNKDSSNHGNNDNNLDTTPLLMENGHVRKTEVEVHSAEMGTAVMFPLVFFSLIQFQA